jgi:hypothetical protein
LRLKGTADRLEGKTRQAAAETGESLRDTADEAKKGTRKHK